MFRFSVNMLSSSGRSAWVDKCRRAEDLGFDVVHVPDHLGMPSPFPALILAAEATSRVRVGTFVLNAPFYNPTLLARDVVGADLFTDGRLELGLGAGYVKEEFEKAELAFARPGARVDHVVRTLDVLERTYADPDEPSPVQQPGPPLVIGGNGDRMLRLAAERAQVVAFPGMAFGPDGRPTLSTAEYLDERVKFAAAAAGDRTVERNMLVQRVVLTDDRAGLLRGFAQELAGMRTPEELAEVPMVLAGSAAGIAEQLRGHQERFGLTYFTVMEEHMDAMAQAIALLR